MEEVRVGVFVCHCGINIGATVNVPEVVKYAKTLPNVVYAEENLFTCSEEGVSAIREKIPEHGLTRVLVASCTPRTHEPLFRAACEEAGLNKYLFELVNIRDQCSWVHMRQPAEATEKAKDLVRMGIARVKHLQPLEEIETPVTRAALIIGGGVAGMSAALDLAAQHFEVHIVEREEALGGMLRHIHTLFPTDHTATELLDSLASRVADREEITVHYGSEVRDVKGFIGNFTVALQDAGEGTAEPRISTSLKVGTIIVATGAAELKPEGQYGYGQRPNVITQLELESQLKDGTFDGKNVVMINCVGARVPERTYCSRFCCMTAVKNAALIKRADPEANVRVLHRDIMAYGVDFEDYYRESMALGVRYVRYDLARPPEVLGDEGGPASRVKLWHKLVKREVDLPVDTVVLTTPMIPREENEAISKMLKVPLSEQGFFLEAHLKLQPVEFATDGIYVAGSARWPTDVGEGISQASYAAAAKASIPMRKGYVRPEASAASVDQARCAGCGTCVNVCAYQAIELIGAEGAGDDRMVAAVNKALCKGCGTCVSSCVSGVITLSHFDDAQILAQLNGLFGPPM